MTADKLRVGGRDWSAGDLDEVRVAISTAAPRQRAEIARRVCRVLDWKDALGRPKLMSCRVALLRLQRAGHNELPPPNNGNGNGNGRRLQRAPVQWPSAEAITGPVKGLRGLRLDTVQGSEDSALWNGLIDRYHYLGYTPLSGAQMRYLIRWDGGVLGALGFGAAAWKVAARDQIAGFGGFLNRKGDGFPGAQTIWIGLQRGRDFSQGIAVARATDASSCG